MKKRLISVLLSLVLVIALLPAAVFAEGETPTVNTINTVSTEDGLREAAVNGGSVQLAADITIGSTLVISKTLILDLNGYVLKYESDTEGSVIEVKNGAELTLDDSRPNQGHKFKVNGEGLWVLDEENGTKTISGGIITGGYASNGGGIMLGATTLKMNGGNIVGCTANNGGGVYLTDNRNDSSYGKFFMNGGRICGCTANYGGAVFVPGAVNDGNALGYGIFWTSRFDMSGGTIENCVAGSGSGVYAPLYGIFEMSGGTIKNCSGDDWTVYDDNGDFSLTGGSIYGNVRYISKKSKGIIATLNFKAGVTVYGEIKLDMARKDYVNGYPDLIYFYTEQGKDGNDTIYATQVVVESSNQPATPIDNPTRAGYKFGGWYTDWDYDDRYECFKENEQVKEGSHGYAKWTETDYTVIFDTDGADSIDKKTEIKWTDTLLDEISEPKKSGYTFAGWKYGNTLVTGSTTYAELVPDDDADNDTITLKAQWTAIVRDDPSYSIIVNEAEHGKLNSSRRHAGRGDRVTLTVEPDTGWSLARLIVSDRNGKALNLDIVEIGEKYSFRMPTGKVTVTATFVENDAIVDADARDYFYDAILRTSIILLRMWLPTMAAQELI